MATTKNSVNSSEYKKYREQFDYIFHKDYFIKQETTSLSEKYKLSIENFNDNYSTGTNTGNHISCQILRLMNEHNIELYQYRNVWGSPFHLYLLHSNRNEYFFCGNDLMEFAIYNITQNMETRFFSNYKLDPSGGNADQEFCYNEFWYITELLYNPVTNLLAINGQDRMNINTVTLVDFTNPDILPLKSKNLLSYCVEKYEDSFCHAEHWTKDNGLELYVCEENSRRITLTHQEIITILENT